MPVRFKGDSEYVRNYKWLDSYRSKSFSPTTEQVAPVAGRSSGELVAEPPLQRRKKPLPITTTSTTQFIADAPINDEYTLIGNQDKFAPSIKYKTKTREKPALAKSYKVNGQSTPDAPRKDKSYSPSKEERVAAVPRPAPVSRFQGHAPASKPEKRQRVDESVQTENATGKDAVDIQAAPKKDKPSSKTTVIKAAPVSKFASQAPMSRRDKRVGAMNEFVQTDMKKGVADSAQEATADYAMKYRAGVPPPRPKGPKRVSEYNKAFHWKTPVEQSPLLAAEQVVYNSNTSLVPSKSAVVSQVSEYQKQFKPYKYQPVKLSSENKDDNKVTPKKKSKMKRSKSEGALAPEQLPPAGVPSLLSPQNRHLIRESLNPQKPFFPHGKYKKWVSEYNSNYRSPEKFEYKEGAWRGANPPHVESAKEIEPVVEMPVSAARGAVSNWFAEVMELRNRAQEYRKRAQGTHFSREHLAQLWAQQNDLWDAASTTSTLSALSLESSVARQRNGRGEAAAAEKEKEVSPVRRRLAWPSDGDNGKRQNNERNGQSTASSTIGSIPSPSEGMRSASLSEAESDLGRVPTPELSPQHGYKKRHHLDVTTPAVGGALLTSPSKVPEVEEKRAAAPVARNGQQGAPRGSRSSSSSSDVSSLARPVNNPKNFDRKVLVPSPAYGLPTRDTHVLMDEEEEYDMPMPTTYTHSPLSKGKARSATAARDRPNSGLMNGRPMSALPQSRLQGVPEAIPEGMGLTYNKIAARDEDRDDDDSLSTSIRSIASSCSLASEVLERARNRRDHFWAKSNGESGRS